MNTTVNTLAAALAFVALPACAALPGVGVQSFALIGDTPYGLANEAKFERVIDAINADPNVRFVVHTGDVKAGSERCDDDLLARRHDILQRFEDGVIVTPGDNDWTDCHRANNGSYQPLERLAKFREIFYSDPRRSGGQHPFKLRTQADMAGFANFPENRLWHFNGATLATVHVVGSNNGLAPWSGIDPADSYDAPRADRVAEASAREAAALAWIDAAFDDATARRAPGVLLAIQANLNLDLPAADRERQGFNTLIERIVARAQAFKKPVVVAHGDSHYYRVDKPFVAPIQPAGVCMVENLTRMENFGAGDVHWVEVFVDPQDPNVFRAEPRLLQITFHPR